ncbi:Arachidonate 5-lipoxygenase [Datura stramonium]|uniref:Arachidonate 5-lipoxygenase n=1 Tax=Datura stramonium TaxID=4076 RepID=A0ABS8TER6_DATST|nr:Arachidonate 5-lipoxygenase [Datura stramonium]
MVSALHEAVNFGQYPYRGYAPNRPERFCRMRGPAISEAVKTYEMFGKKLAQIEENISMMNNDVKLKNRTGPGKMSYTLLYPTSEPGLTSKGIPNCIPDLFQKEFPIVSRTYFKRNSQLYLSLKLLTSYSILVVRK